MDLFIDRNSSGPSPLHVTLFRLYPFLHLYVKSLMHSTVQSNAALPTEAIYHLHLTSQ